MYLMKVGVAFWFEIVSMVGLRRLVKSSAEVRYRCWVGGSLVEFFKN